MALDNRDIDAVLLRTEMDTFLTTLKKTYPLWNVSKWPQPGAEGAVEEEGRGEPAPQNQP
jgi:hypothetical protein